MTENNESMKAQKSPDEISKLIMGISWKDVSNNDVEQFSKLMEGVEVSSRATVIHDNILMTKLKSLGFMTISMLIFLLTEMNPGLLFGLSLAFLFLSLIYTQFIVNALNSMNSTQSDSLILHLKKLKRNNPLEDEGSVRFL